MNLSKPSKALVVIFSCSLFVACSNSGDTKTSTTPAPDTAASAKPATVSAAPSKGLELIGGSDCTTCHRLQQASSGPAIGPAYSEVAKKYAPAADTTIARLVKKIQTGGTGVWGTLPMTPHPALKEADIKEMLSYIMSLKQPG